MVIDNIMFISICFFYFIKYILYSLTEKIEIQIKFL